MADSDIRDYGASQSNPNNSPAIQNALNATGVAVIPPGDWGVQDVIYTAGKGITIEGSGKSSSRLVKNSPGDLFLHQVNTPNNQLPLVAPYQVRGLTIATAVSGAGTCFYIKQNGDHGQLTMEEVAVTSFSDQFSWSRHGQFIGTTRASFINLEFEGGSYNQDLSHSTPVSIELISQDQFTKIFDVNFERCNIDAVTHAVRCSTQNGDATIEGIKFSRTNGRTVRDAWLRGQFYDAPNRAPPYYSFDTCNMEGPGLLVSMDSVSEFRMVNCLHYVDAPYPGQGAPTDFINLGRCLGAYIGHNHMKLYDGAVVTTMVSAKGGSNNIWHRDNLYDRDNTGAVTFATFASSAAGSTFSSGNRYLIPGTQEVF